MWLGSKLGLCVVMTNHCFVEASITAGTAVQRWRWGGGGDERGRAGVREREEREGMSQIG